MPSCYIAALNLTSGSRDPGSRRGFPSPEGSSCQAGSRLGQQSAEQGRYRVASGGHQSLEQGAVSKGLTRTHQAATGTEGSDGEPVPLLDG